MKELNYLNELRLPGVEREGAYFRKMDSKAPDDKATPLIKLRCRVQSLCLGEHVYIMCTCVFLSIQYKA